MYRRCILCCGNDEPFDATKWAAKLWVRIGFVGYTRLGINVR